MNITVTVTAADLKIAKRLLQDCQSRLEIEEHMKDNGWDDAKRASVLAAVDRLVKEAK